MIDWVALTIFIFFFLLVTVIGFVAARWRRGNLKTLEEWGLAGRKFGTVITWFLLGGDIYTAYTFVAVPGLVFAAGAMGFFAVPYTVLIYPLAFIVLPKFWSVCKANGYVTPSDFVEGQTGSKTLAFIIALTGIVATMPYIALQMFGIAVSVAQMGINPEVALVVAFVILAAYTYTSGLRAPALIAMVKDAMIFIVLFATIIVIPISLGGFGPIFRAAQEHAAGTPAFHFILAPAQFMPYASLVLGSALALFLYPHALTGTLASGSPEVVKRNAALLPGILASAGTARPAGIHGNCGPCDAPQGVWGERDRSRVDCQGVSLLVRRFLLRGHLYRGNGSRLHHVHCGGQSLHEEHLSSLPPPQLLERRRDKRRPGGVAGGEVGRAAVHLLRADDLHHQPAAPGRHHHHPDPAVGLPGAVHEVVQQVGTRGGMGGGHRERHLDVCRGAQQLRVHVRDQPVTAWGSTRHCRLSSSTWQ